VRVSFEVNQEICQSAFSREVYSCPLQKLHGLQQATQIVALVTF